MGREGLAKLRSEPIDRRARQAARLDSQVISALPVPFRGLIGGFPQGAVSFASGSCKFDFRGSMFLDEGRLLWNTSTTDSLRPGRMGEFLARWCRACATCALLRFSISITIQR